MAQGKVACLLGEGFEDSEFRIPYDRVRNEGYQVDIIGPKAGYDYKLLQQILERHNLAQQLSTVIETGNTDIMAKYAALVSSASEGAVTTGRRGPDWIEIKAGVNVGQSVILDPGNLQAGQPVTTTEGQN